MFAPLALTQLQLACPFCSRRRGKSSHRATRFRFCSRIVLSRIRRSFRVVRWHQTLSMCAAFVRLLQLNLVLHFAEIHSRESIPSRAKARHIIPAADYVASSTNMRAVEDHRSIRMLAGTSRRLLDELHHVGIPILGYERTSICKDPTTGLMETIPRTRSSILSADPGCEQQASYQMRYPPPPAQKQALAKLDELLRRMTRLK